MNDDAQSWEPQFLRDRDTWSRLLFETPDPGKRLAGYDSAPDVLLGEILRYGAYNDPAMIPALQGLYDGLLGDEMPLPLSLRREIYRHAAGFQQSASVISANANLPFIACESDCGIVSTAVIDYVSVAPLTAGDPMSRVRDVVGMVEARFPRNVGAAFGALLYLGDPRLCRVLWPLKDSLEEAEVREAMRCHTGFLSAATTDFLVSWLLGMDGDARDSLFGHIASGLALQRRDMRVPLVMTGERPFPVTSVSPEEQHRMQSFIPIEEFTRRITPALLQLERTEPEPKVMPSVLAIWGIEPPRRGALQSIMTRFSRSPRKM
jgi:hypothetical protein